MAICHVSVQVISRSEGRTATGAAAYRSAAAITNTITKTVYNYTHKTGVDHSEILTPKLPTVDKSWLMDRAQLWNEVEKKEKRYDAQLAREVNVAIPVELDRQDQIDLVREYAQTSYIDRGMVADINWHDLDSNNPHAHIMLTMRDLVVSNAQVEFGNKNRDWNNRNLLIDQRREWAEITNRYLERAGYDVKIDHRSLVEQGITDRLPQIHLGANVAAMRERGIATDRGDEYDRINTVNAEIREQLEKIYQAETELADLGKAETSNQQQDQQLVIPTLGQLRAAHREKLANDDPNGLAEIQAAGIELNRIYRQRHPNYSGEYAPAHFRDTSVKLAAHLLSINSAPNPVNEQQTQRQPKPRRRRDRPDFERHRRDFDQFTQSLENDRPETRTERPLDRNRRPAPDARQIERENLGQHINHRTDKDRRPAQPDREKDRQNPDFTAIRAEFDQLSERIADAGIGSAASNEGLDRERDSRSVLDLDVDINELDDLQHQERARDKDPAGAGIYPAISTATTGTRPDGERGGEEDFDEEEEEEIDFSEEPSQNFKPGIERQRPSYGHGLSM
jgi:MobA/MobL family